MSVKFNLVEYPVSHYNLPKLRLQEYIKKSLNKKAVFSSVDLKLMIGNCTTYLNLLSSVPLFMISQLRTFLCIQNLNFREIDIYCERMAKEERENHNSMKESIRKMEEVADMPEELRKSSILEFKDTFNFKGVDRTAVFGKSKYTLFCNIGQSSWYCEKTCDEVKEFIKSLRKEEREKKDAWLR